MMAITPVIVPKDLWDPCVKILMNVMRTLVRTRDLVQMLKEKLFVFVHLVLQDLTVMSVSTTGVDLIVQVKKYNNTFHYYCLLLECSITCNNGGTPNLTNCSSCICPPGFTGSHCEIPDREDCSDKCLNGGTCLNISGNYTCVCSPGYIGPNCSKVDPCESSPCLNGGKCKIDGNDRFVCECIDGWSGNVCQHCDDSDFNDCILSTTISPLQEESKTGLVVGKLYSYNYISYLIYIFIAIVLSVLGLVAIATLISALYLLYKRYQRHKDTVKIANINEDIWDG